MTPPDWLVAAGPWIAGGSAVLSLALVVASVVLLPRALAAMPEDWLLHDPPPPPFRERVWRNALGGALIVLGVLMLVLPGQGVLTVLAGLVLADVPGKRRLVHAMVAVPVVRSGVDAIRARSGQPPLRHP